MEEGNDQLVLTKEEWATCEYVATAEAPHSLRARAILALAGGASVAETAVKTGLTENQVKLWRGRFRNSRVAIFPDEVTAVPDPDTPTPEKPSKKKGKKKKDKDKKQKKKDKKDKKKGKGKDKGKAKKKAK